MYYFRTHFNDKSFVELSTAIYLETITELCWLLLLFNEFIHELSST